MAISGIKYRRPAAHSAARFAARFAAGGPLPTARVPAVVPDMPGGESIASALVDAARYSPGDFDSRFNERVAGAQLALQYLDQLGDRLQGLRAGIGRCFAADSGTGAKASDTVFSQVDQLTELWLLRHAATVGTLNSVLEYSAAGDARQKFTVRGLDFDSLRANPSPEIVNFSIGGNGHRAGSSVTVEPNLSNAAFVHRLDRSLAPSGVRAAQTPAGTLIFSVLETQWPSVRDTFTVMGEGKRFSTGRFSRVRIVPEAPVLHPEEWNLANIEGMRIVRQDIFKAQGAVRQARQVVARGYADAGAHLEAQSTPGARAAEALWCAGFIETFVTTAGRSDYLTPASFAPTLTRVDRQRVVTLLGQSSNDTT